jgi:hypothetical protein
MFDAIRKILGNAAAVRTAPKTDTTNAVPSIEHYFQAEIMRSMHIKPDAANVVMDHMTGKIDILRSGEKLSADEKKSLGLNSRQSITRELIGVLSQSGMALSRPASAIEDIWIRANHRRSRDEQLVKLRRAGVRSFVYESSGVETDCAWCNKNYGRTFPASHDIGAEEDRECTCSPCAQSYLRPIVNFNDL